MTSARPPGPGSCSNVHGSVEKKLFVFVNVPLQFSSTVMVIEKPCAEAPTHQPMTKAKAPAAAARSPFSYQRMTFMIALPIPRVVPKPPRRPGYAYFVPQRQFIDLIRLLSGTGNKL